MIVEKMVEGGCFEAVEALAEHAYIGRGRFDWAKVREEAHKSLDDRYGEAQVELCIEKCKG